MKLVASPKWAELSALISSVTRADKKGDKSISIFLVIKYNKLSERDDKPWQRWIEELIQRINRIFALSIMKLTIFD